MTSKKLGLVILIFFSISCKDQSIQPDQVESPQFTTESSKCISTAFSRGLAVSNDSIFTYSFSQDLIIDFSVRGNCCPDSNRFTLGHEIRNDTIFIAVSYTAQNLCRCICVYMIHVKLADLPLNHYVVRCRLSDGYTTTDPIHLVSVQRYQLLM